MAIKTKYCPHEVFTYTYRPSKSSRIKCCKECFLSYIEKEINISQGEEVATKLKWIKNLKFDFPICNVREVLMITWGNCLMHGREEAII